VLTLPAAAINVTADAVIESGSIMILAIVLHEWLHQVGIATEASKETKDLHLAYEALDFWGPRLMTAVCNHWTHDRYASLLQPNQEIE
jgi:hypothetical protein